MANEEHLNLLRQGVDIWNKKRPDVVDLTEVTLSGVNLRGFNLRGANLSRTDLYNANLSNSDLSGASLTESYLIGANLSGANLRGAYLRRASLIGASLIGANLSGANLRGADLSSTNLNGGYLLNANLSGTDLSGTDLRGADLSRSDLSGAYLNKANLSGANLRGAKLREVDLSGANLNEVNLNLADLRDANFRATQLLATNFSNAHLTGACIEDWNINIQTNLTNIICYYIYLKCEESDENGENIFTERRPSNPDENFAPGDLARLVQKTIETVDLIFRDGIEWKSFAVSLQELNQEAKIKIASESEKDPLSIRAIETRDDGSFVIRVNIPAELDKAEIEKSLKQKYVKDLEATEEYYRRELHAKDTEIKIYRQENTNWKEIAVTLANRPITINNHNMPNNGDTYNLNGPTGIAHSSGEIKDSKIAGVLNEAPQENINMIKVEIEQILQPLLKQYPKEQQQELVKNLALAQIAQKPDLMKKLKNATKEGSLAALEQSLNHPVCSFIINAVKGWQEAQ